MDFLARRSIRKYISKDIENEKLNEILKAGLSSPTGKNIKPFELIVVKNKEKLKKMAKAKDSGSGSMLEGANLGIVVLGDPEKSNLWNEDCSIVSFSILLKAFDLGIGGCWVNVKGHKHSSTLSSEEYLTNLLNIPKNLKIVSIISLGYPDEQKVAYEDKDLDFSKIHFEN
ncbi:MAG: nitroreductase family protein [Cetobacterium sp.]|uniref:nitroreductase family protein n=1 Tax=unclassified Cetobacterium TaxID=2630983 RepID=UPI0006489140|nr:MULTISPECIES: nitroreductase family protein [unclassified Cetobacterium]